MFFSQHGKNNFWKSSWLQEEIVSHVEGFKRPYKNKQGYSICSGETLGFKGRSNQKAYNHDDNSVESHWSMSQPWLLLFHWHTPHRKWRLHSFPSVCRRLLILGQLSGTFTKSWNPVTELCKISYPWRVEQSWITRDRWTAVKSFN